MLALRYEHDNNTGMYKMRVVRQDSREFDFRAKNGWSIRAQSYPELAEYDYILFVRGHSIETDEAILRTDNVACLKQIARAVAEFNGRKNVATIGESGFII
jgi:hypothetical protein